MRRSKYFVCLSACWSFCCRIQCHHIFLGPEDIQHLGQVSYTHFLHYRKQLTFIPTDETLPQVLVSCPWSWLTLSCLTGMENASLSLLIIEKLNTLKYQNPFFFFFSSLGYLPHSSTSHYFLLTFYISHVFISTGVGFVNVLGRKKRPFMTNLQKLTMINRN